MTPPPSPRARLITGLVAATVLATALLSGTPDAKTPLTPDTIVADLGSGPPLSPPLRAAMQTQRARPHDLPATLTAARLMIAEGRSQGDSRLIGAALSMLQPFVQNRQPEAQYLAATARQYQHDFPGALALLDAVLTTTPRDVNALLNRATIYTVLGDYPPALRDCTAIAALRPDVGFLCQATALTLTRDAPAVAARLQTILATPGALDPSLVPWATSLRGEIALLQGDVATAETHLRNLLAADPAAQREQLMLADLLLAQGRPADVLPLLQSAPDTDGTLIRRILAHRALGDDAPDLVTTLATRAQRSLDLGLVAHAREEAMFYLLITDNPAQALERAQANWALQHEFDDARLLIRAADAAGNPQAAQPVLDWMQTAGVDIPALPLPPSVAALKP